MKLKTRQLGILSLCVGIFALSQPAQAQFQKVFGAKSATLANGMQVVVVENHRAPVVTHMLWYQVGSADEPKGDGVSGAAHFLEHLMFKGSEAIAPGEFSKLIRNIGGDDNAFTSWDYTSFFQTIPSKYLPQVMALEADRMINLSLADRDIESEREVIIEERRMRTDNDPQSLFMEQMRAELFPNSAYAEPIIGWRDEMPLLNRQDVMEYYKTWYTPGNAILVVSGDVDFDNVVKLANKFYGIIPSHAYPEHIRSKSPDFRAKTLITLHDENVQQPTLYKAWLVPSFMDDKHSYYSFEVLAEAISGNASTKLYQTLVVNRKVATSISLSYDGDARGQGSLWLYAIPAPGVSMETLENEINTAFREIVGNGIDEQDVEKAKTRMIDQALFARDSVTGPAMVIGQALALGATLDDVENWPQKIDSITRDDVQTIFDMYLNPEAPKRLPVTGILTPAENTAENKEK